MTLSIKIHNVGHGLAVFATTPNEQSIVIDLGAKSDFSPLEWLLRNTRTIDYLIITHPHGDHIDEIEKLSHFHIDQINRPNHLSAEAVIQANQPSYASKVNSYMNLSSSYRYPISEESRVGNPSNSGGVEIQVFYSRSCGQSNINNHSGVVYFSYEGIGIMIPGDNESPSWTELLDSPSFRAAWENTDIFIASHHGRESGYHSELFYRKPKLCIVSDGRVQNTDATSRYSSHATGMDINKRHSKSTERRNCLTTRTDGTIDIEVSSRLFSEPSLNVFVD